MARTITLVLLGGGVMLGGAAMLMGPGSNRENRQRECQEASAQNRPDAEQICAAARTYSSSGSGYHGSSWFFGRSGRSSASTTGGSALIASSGFRGSATTVSSRGGFGSSSRSFSSSGS